MKCAWSSVYASKRSAISRREVRVCSKGYPGFVSDSEPWRFAVTSTNKQKRATWTYTSYAYMLRILYHFSVPRMCDKNFRYFFFLMQYATKWEQKCSSQSKFRMHFFSPLTATVQPIAQSFSIKWWEIEQINLISFLNIFKAFCILAEVEPPIILDGRIIRLRINNLMEK